MSDKKTNAMQSTDTTSQTLNNKNISETLPANKQSDSLSQTQNQNNNNNKNNYSNQNNSNNNTKPPSTGKMSPKNPTQTNLKNKPITKTQIIKDNRVIRPIKPVPNNKHQTNSRNETSILRTKSPKRPKKIPTGAKIKINANANHLKKLPGNKLLKADVENMNPSLKNTENTDTENTSNFTQTPPIIDLTTQDINSTQLNDNNNTKNSIELSKLSQIENFFGIDFPTDNLNTVIASCVIGVVIGFIITSLICLCCCKFFKSRRRKNLGGRQRSIKTTESNTLKKKHVLKSPANMLTPERNRLNSSDRKKDKDATNPLVVMTRPTSSSHPTGPKYLNNNHQISNGHLGLTHNHINLNSPSNLNGRNAYEQSYSDYNNTIDHNSSILFNHNNNVEERQQLLRNNSSVMSVPLHDLNKSGNNFPTLHENNVVNYKGTDYRCNTILVWGLQN